MKYRDIIGYSNKKSKKKVVKKESKPSVTDVLKEQFGDVINEGPAGDYEMAHVKVSKSYHKFMDDYMKFERLLINKGLKTQARQLDKAYKGVEKFWKFYHKMLDKLS
jgi:replicative DNA helicase